MNHRTGLSMAGVLATAAALEMRLAARFVDGSRRTYDKRKKQVSETSHLRERTRNLKKIGRLPCRYCSGSYPKERPHTAVKVREIYGYPDVETRGYGCSPACAEKDRIATLDQFFDE